MGEIREDLIQIKSITTKIRTYGCSDTLYNITEEASSLGISVVQGVWLDQNPETSENEVRSSIALANRGLVESVVVGNEILLTETLSESQLIDYIRQVKDSVPEDVKVTTAEPWHIWLENPSLVDAVDCILIHVHPFWEGKPIETAAEYVIERYYEVKAHSGNKDVVIGETGWPSGGTPEDALVPPNVVPSEENLLMFLKEFSQLAYEHSIEYYFFSAYDEEWKWKERRASQGMADLPLPLDRNLGGRLPGSSWGIFYSDGQIKSELGPFFPQVVNSTSRTTRVIFDTRGLAVFYDMGVDSSYRRQDWLEMSGEEMQMVYPAGQSWGAVFITVGEPVDHPRPWKDFSQFQSISVEMKGEHGGEFVEIGLKDAYDPDDGSEAKIMVSGLTPTWQSYEFPLSSFYTADLDKLYVVVEFVFSGSEAQTIYFRNIKYLL